MRYRWLLFIAIAASAFAVWAIWIANDGRGLFVRRPEAPDHAWMQAKLAETATLEFENVPLKKVLAQLSRRHGVEIRTYDNPFDEIAVTGDKPVTVHAKGISLRSAARIAARLADWSFGVGTDGESLVVTEATTAVSSPWTFVGRVYPLSPFTLPNGSVCEKELAEFIQGSVSSVSWTDRFKAEIEVLPAGLAAANTLDAHLQVESLLSRLEQTLGNPGDYSPIDVPDPLALKNEAVWAALDKRVSVQVADVPLSEACRELSRRSGVPVLLHTKLVDEYIKFTAKEDALTKKEMAVLDEWGSVANWPVSVTADNRPLGLVLKTMLATHTSHLEYEGRDEVIWIKPGYARRDPKFLRIYPVGDLLRPANHSVGNPCRELIDIIKLIVTPESWQSRKGVRLIIGVGDVIVVSQTWEGHKRIEWLLRSFREMLDPTNMVVGHPSWKTNCRLEEALAERINLKVEDTPLTDVLQRLNRQHRIDLVVDKWELREHDTEVDQPLTYDAKDVPLERVLHDILRPLGLTFCVRGDWVEVTDDDPDEPELRCYDLRHLIDPDVGLADAEQLDKLTRELGTEPPWGGHPGCARQHIFRGILVLAHRRDVHHNLSALLDELTRYQQRPPSLTAMLITNVLQEGLPSLLEKLRQKVSIEYVEVPLARIAQDLSERFGLPIDIDEQSLRTAGISPKLRMNLTARNVSLGQAVESMLHGSYLRFDLQPGRVEISSGFTSLFEKYCKIYPVADLVHYPAAPPVSPAGPDKMLSREMHDSEIKGKYAPLIGLVGRIADEWARVADFGSVVACEGALIVEQTFHGHRRTGRFLGRVRHLLWPDQHPDPALTSLERTLAKTDTIISDDDSIENVLADVARRHGFTIDLACRRADNFTFHNDPFTPTFVTFAQQRGIPIELVNRMPFWTLSLRRRVNSRLMSLLDLYDQSGSDHRPTGPAESRADVAVNILRDSLDSAYPWQKVAVGKLRAVVHRWNIKLNPLRQAIHCRFEDVRLGDALIDLLSPRGFGLYLDGDVLRVRFAKSADINLRTCIHDVRHLLPTVLHASGGAEPELSDLPFADSFMDFIAEQVIYSEGMEVSERERVHLYYGLVIVAHHERGQREFRELLRAMNDEIQHLPPITRLWQWAKPEDTNVLLNRITATKDERGLAYLVFLVRRIRPAAVATIPVLVRKLQEMASPRPGTGHDTLWRCLGDYGAEAADAVPVLAERLHTLPSAKRRATVLDTLGDIGEAATSELVRYLFARVENGPIADEEWLPLMIALAKVEPPAVDAIEPLLRLLVRSVATRRPAIENALAAIDPEGNLCRQIAQRWEASSDDETYRRGWVAGARLKSIYHDF